jgi:phosphonate transport system substrate-binding protein
MQEGVNARHSCLYRHNQAGGTPIMTTFFSRRALLRLGVAGAVLLIVGQFGISNALAAETPIRFVVGPHLPTPDDTRKEWEPMFRSLAEKIGRPYSLVATSDWAGIAIALSSGKADVGFVGPWGRYIQGNHRRP